VELPTRTKSVEIIDFCGLLRSRREGLVAMAVDIPIGLLDKPPACNLAALTLLGPPCGSSLFLLRALQPAWPVRIGMPARLSAHLGKSILSSRNTGLVDFLLKWPLSLHRQERQAKNSPGS